jgi:hypothetical protein
VEDGAGDSVVLDGTGNPLKGTKPQECEPAETLAGHEAEQTAEVVRNGEGGTEREMESRDARGSSRTSFAAAGEGLERKGGRFELSALEGKRNLRRGCLVDGVPDRNEARIRPGDGPGSPVEGLKSTRGVPTVLATSPKGPQGKPAKVRSRDPRPRSEQRTNELLPAALHTLKDPVNLARVESAA